MKITNILNESTALFALATFKLLKKARLCGIKASSIHSTSKIESGTTFYGSSMDRHSFCGYDCDIYFADIGSFTSIANGVVLGGGRHPMEWVSMSPVFYEGRDSVKAKFSTHSRELVKRVVVGHDVWIGRSAIILPNVAVGDGAVVGAGSVVTKSVPPYGVVAGNPARLVRFRFDDKTIARLTRTQWWSLPDEELKRLGPNFNDVDKALEMLERKFL